MMLICTRKRMAYNVLSEQTRKLMTYNVLSEQIKSIDNTVYP